MFYILIFLFKLRIPSGCIKVGPEEVIERPHVKLLGEENVIGNVLHDLAHERQATLYTWRWLNVDNTGLTWRH